jgi:6-phosphogluconolactonase (cycloisomerase 2 family)
MVSAHANCLLYVITAIWKAHLRGEFQKLRRYQMPFRREIGLACLCILLAFTWSGCSDSPSTPKTVSVTVTPGTASVQTGATKQFTAAVSNASNAAVDWQVNGVAGGNATVGTISSSGLYTAPASVPAPATVTVTAVSQADSTKSGTASVTVTAPPAVTVTVSPKTPSVAVNGTQQFTATVANSANTAVTWEVNGTAGGDATVGTITAGGLYTAPATIPNPVAVTVTAVSVADNTKFDNATVTITAAPAITVTVSPSTPSVPVNGTQQFTATVTGTANTAVTWQVNDVTGGNAAVGTISGAGLYTAPASVPNPASVTVKAISNADNTTFGTATATVTAAATARFAYVSSFPDDKIAIFSVNDATGLLTASTTTSLPAGSNPSFLGMHSSGKFLYSLNQGTNKISIFTINAATGALTAAGTVTTSAGPFYMVFSPNGDYAYVTCDAASAVLGFSVNTTTGALTPVSGSPYAISGGRVRGLAITPDDKYLYVSDRDATPTAITGFTINSATGVLTKMAAPFSGDFIGTLVVDKTGTHLYAGSPDDVNVSGYSINGATGALTFVNDYPAGTSSTSAWLFDPTGTYLYGGSTADNKVFGYKQNADGSLTSISGMPVGAATFPNGGGIHPNGKFAYVVSTISDTTLQPGVITIYNVSSTTGAFSLLNSTPAGVNNTIGFAITP